jgi:hypothetical protein
MAAELPRIVRDRLRAEFGGDCEGFELHWCGQEGGVTVYRLTGWGLVPYGTGEFADVMVPVPVEVVVRATRIAVLGVSVQEASASAIREARAFAGALFARGAVAGVPAAAVPPGPPVRPTHALERLSGGRRVLRRLGVAR